MKLVLLFLLAFSQPKLDEIFLRLIPTTQAGIGAKAAAIVPTKNARIQMKLLEEDLIWQDRGYTKRQIKLIVTLVLYKAIGLAEKITKDPTEEQKKKLDDIKLFIEMATILVEKNVKELGDFQDYELTFYLSS